MALYRGSRVECVASLASPIRRWEEGWCVFLIFYSWDFSPLNTFSVTNVWSLVVLRNTKIFRVVCNSFLFPTSLVSHTKSQIWYSVCHFAQGFCNKVSYISVWGGFLYRWTRICFRIVFIKVKYSYIKIKRKLVGAQKKTSLYWKFVILVSVKTRCHCTSKMGARMYVQCREWGCWSFTKTGIETITSRTRTGLWHFWKKC